MTTHVFVSRSRVPPLRWREAFPSAQVVSQIPTTLSPGILLWLHNQLPTDLSPPPPPGTRIIVLHDKPSDEHGLAALSAGAVGYANAHATPEMLRTIEAVVRNDGLWVGEMLLSRLLRTLAKTPVATNPGEAKLAHPALAKLSEREREIALKVANGESNKEIAREVGVAERTVKAHLTSIFEKLALRDRLQLAILLKTGN